MSGPFISALGSSNLVEYTDAGIMHQRTETSPARACADDCDVLTALGCLSPVGCPDFLLCLISLTAPLHLTTSTRMIADCACTETPVSREHACGKLEKSLYRLKPEWQVNGSQWQQGTHCQSVGYTCTANGPYFVEIIPFRFPCYYSGQTEAARPTGTSYNQEIPICRAFATLTVVRNRSVAIHRFRVCLSKFCCNGHGD